jgi:23S rRNA (pseudouridine1915-N3)-methyltransferase
LINIKFIVLGNIKEQYLRDAAAEYIKRLGAFAKVELCELKEARLPDSPSDAHIAAALEDEAQRILAVIPPRSHIVALAVEGKQLSSEEFAAHMERVSQKASTVCFIIGSSHGLSQRIKNAADMRLSLSKMTFPHQLFRVMLLESVYRSFNIIKGTKYHK